MSNRGVFNDDAYRTRSTTTGIEKKNLLRIYRPKKNNDTQTYEIETPCDTQGEPNINAVVRTKISELAKYTSNWRPKGPKTKDRKDVDRRRL